MAHGCVQAKEARGAHKEELKHTHDKGLANLSNAAVRAWAARRRHLAACLHTECPAAH